MIRISQLKMPLGHTGNDLLLKAAKELHIQPELIKETKLVKQICRCKKKAGDPLQLYRGYCIKKWWKKRRGTSCKEEKRQEYHSSRRKTICPS